MTNWLTKEVIKQHRTIGTMVNLLLHSGLVLNHLEEWGPTEDQIAVHPEWAEPRDRPMFLLLSAQKG